MKFWMDIALPVIGGAIGSTVTVFWDEVKTKRPLPFLVKLKYAWLGAVSGFVAVNLLNPEGSFSVKAPLAILAGVSPMSFLKGQAITDGGEEDEAFKNYSEGVRKYTNLFDEEIDVPDSEGDLQIKTVFEKIKDDAGLKGKD